MNTIVLFVNSEKWSIEEWHARKGGYWADDGSLLIEDGDSWIFLLEQERIFDDYEDAERKEVTKLIPISFACLVDWDCDILL